MIRPRTPVFLGCEGESEVGYGALLSRIAHELPGVHLHLQVDILKPGAGDPLELVRLAVRRIAHLERTRSSFRHRAILLDPGAQQKNQQAQALADENGIILIWQDSDHEAFLLRHLPNCLHRRPPAGESFAELRAEWPNYKKALPQLRLAERIDFACIQRVRKVEPQLNHFLTSIGIA